TSASSGLKTVPGAMIAVPFAGPSGMGPLSDERKSSSSCASDMASRRGMSMTMRPSGRIRAGLLMENRVIFDERFAIVKSVLGGASSAVVTRLAAGHLLTVDGRLYSLAPPSRLIDPHAAGTARR